MRSWMERGPRVEVIAAAILVLLLSVAGCRSGGSPPGPVPAVADRPLGRFIDDYGEHYDITPHSWTQLPHGRLRIEGVDLEHGFLVAQNDSTNPYDPGKWSRIDWIRLDGMAPWEWAYCLSAYDAPTADSARATRIARPDRPRSGCNGHPFTRLERSRVPSAAMIERCHQFYLAAGSDGPKLLAVDAVIVDSTTTPPTRCGQVRSAHPAIKSSE